jgi:hypothetical protein
LKHYIRGGIGKKFIRMKLPLGLITITVISLKIAEITSFQISGPLRYGKGKRAIGIIDTVIY